MKTLIALAVLSGGLGLSGLAQAEPMTSSPASGTTATTNDGIVSTAGQSEEEKKKKKKGSNAGSGSDKRGS